MGRMRRLWIAAVALGLACAQKQPETRDGGRRWGIGGSGGIGGTGGSGGSGGTGGGVDALPPGTIRRPFGRQQSYPAGILPAGSRTSLDSAVRAFYDRWKRTYVTQGCGGYYVKTGGGTGAEGALTVSEAHGYGMLATVIMAGHDSQAQSTFDGFHAVFRGFRSESDSQLMLWAINPGCTRHPEGSSAADGDLDIAYALLMADRQWGSGGQVNYLESAGQAVQAVNRSDINRNTRLPRLGDWVNSGEFVTAVRASDIMPGHFRAFASLGNAADWMRSVDASYTLINAVQSGLSPQTGLVPDFILGTDGVPRPANPDFHEGPHDGRYYYNACRVPWRLGTDYVLTGDARAKAAVDRLTAWIKTRTGNDPSRIRDGYALDGGEVGMGPSLAFEAPFGVAAMSDPSHQSWLNAIYARITTAPPAGYYEDTVALLSLIVMTGNWW